MAKRRKQKEFNSVKAHAAARREAYFAAGGTARGWSLRAGAGRHGVNKSKAAQNARACRQRVGV